jgi:hypothetical protein
VADSPVTDPVTDSVTDSGSPRILPQYGTCGTCRQLKHVRPDGRVRNHNRFSARGTAISQLRCGGSGTPAVERRTPEPVEVRRTA